MGRGVDFMGSQGVGGGGMQGWGGGKITVGDRIVPRKKKKKKILIFYIKTIKMILFDVLVNNHFNNYFYTF